MKNQQNRLLARLIQKKREKNKIDAIKNVKEISPSIPQKYELPSEITTNSSMHINQKTWKKWINSWTLAPFQA